MGKALSVTYLISAIIFLSCSGDDDSCTPHVAQYCEDDISYWVDSCGELEEVAHVCEEGCKADRSGCDYPNLSVQVSPTQVTVALSEEQQFVATVNGADTSVTWHVLEGDAHGTIDASGLYTAPSALPNPAAATVQVVSVADPSKIATANVTLRDEGNETISEEERVLCLVTFGVSDEIGDLGDELVGMAAQAVWTASEWNGGQATFTGTLTQVAVGSEVFNYTASPADRLVIVFADGLRLEFQFTTFDGYVDGSWEDFTRSHDLLFDVSVADLLDLQVQSWARPGNPDDPAYSFRCDYERRLIGSADYEGHQVSLDITYTGKEQWHVDGRFAFYDYEEIYTGSASTQGIDIVVREAAHAYLSHDASIGSHLRNHQIWNDSQATWAGVSYAFDQGYVAWAMGSLLNDPGAFNLVVDTNYWAYGGRLLKGGQVFGTLQFDGPVVADSHGPDLVLLLTDGQEVLLHPLIEYP